MRMLPGSLNRDRPLERMTSLKLKLAVLVGASALAAAVVAAIGDGAGVPMWASLPVTIAAALGITWWLARGLTAPLLEMSQAAVAMAAGDYTATVSTGANDEIGLLARSFSSMASDLAEVDRQRRQLLATVSHELRTPLAAQCALLENLVDGVSQPDPDVLRAALAQAERLSHLVADLLDLSRIDAGLATLRLERFAVRELLDQAVAEAEVGPRLVRHEILLDPPELQVRGDRARLAQVVANLLDNAGRHSPAGGTVRISAGLAGEDAWLLQVADDGPGLTPQNAQALFQRFRGGEPVAGDSGLGLAIAGWVCHLHGGTIEALPPVPGETGARVRAVLPRSPGEAFVSTEEHNETAAAGSGAESGPGSAAGPVTAVATVPADALTSTYRGSATDSGSAAPDLRPLPEALFGTWWPERNSRPQQGLVAGSLAVGALAAITLPWRNLGLGVFFVLVAGGVLVWRASPRRHEPWTLLSAALSLGLGTLVVLRADEVPVVLAIMLTGFLVVTALTAAWGVGSMLAAAVAWVLAGIRGLPLLGATLRAMSRRRLAWPIVRTAAISIVLVAFFGSLFASADAVFGAWAASILPRWNLSDLTYRSFVGFVIGGVVLAGCYLALNPPHLSHRSSRRPSRQVRAWEWQVPLTLVVLLFVAFIAAEGQGFFGGHEYLRQTTGLTYAAYVHQGFGQLTVATAATLALVAWVSRVAGRAQARDRLTLRLLVGALCLLTLLVVASALYRMHLYQQAFGFTVLRVLVDGFEAWLGLIVVFTMVAGLRLNGRWIPRAALVSAAVLMLGFGLVNPGAWVATRNIERYHATGKLDVAYLRSLGDDAVPTIADADLPGAIRRCVIAPPVAAASPDGLFGWNLGRSRAREIRAARAFESTKGCPTQWNPVGSTAPAPD